MHPSMLSTFTSTVRIARHALCSMGEGFIQGSAGVSGTNKIDKAKGISSHRLVELPPGAHKMEAMLSNQ